MDKQTVDQARKEAEEAYVKFSLLRDAFIKAETNYFKKLRQFKDMDYVLALTDGRLKKIPTGEKGRETKKQPELTLDQLKSIAAKLGVNISVEEPEEELDDEFEDSGEAAEVKENGDEAKV